MASRSEAALAVLVWHYHDDDVAGPDAAVELELRGVPRDFTQVTHFRIDGEHSNAYAAWQRLGAPIAPDVATWDSLRAAGRLAELQEPSDIRATRGAARLSFSLPRQAVSLLRFAPRR
jgi:xylan 1,4-beta-xylosidase